MQPGRGASGAEAEAAGADAVLVFPPNCWALFEDEEPPRSITARREASGLPLVLYQARSAPAGWPIRRTIGRVGVETGRGIKEGSWEVATYEANRRLLTQVRPDVAVLGSGDEHLLTVG